VIRKLAAVIAAVVVVGFVAIQREPGGPQLLGVGDGGAGVRRHRRGRARGRDAALGQPPDVSGGARRGADRDAFLAGLAATFGGADDEGDED
jgi:hypothetical protein